MLYFFDFRSGFLSTPKIYFIELINMTSQSLISATIVWTNSVTRLIIWSQRGSGDFICSKAREHRSLGAQFTPP